VIPAAVGVDIGCGMIAVRTQLTSDALPTTRAAVRTAIERAIPVSAGGANRSVTATAEPRIAELEALAAEAGFDPAEDVRAWRLQLGSLGSGNHFIEITVDEQRRVWLFLHSGSRGIGNRIAQRHIDVAKRLARSSGLTLPDADLAHLTEGTAEFDRYIAELRWAQRFALLNREEMMSRLIRAFEHWVGERVVESERINCHHNYTEREHHFGQDVWLSRKGAIDASRGRPGLIPGSMGTASYVVEGRGDELALRSSPHGAGREYSRTAARKRFTRDELETAMRGIEWRHSDAFLDEIPQAYKPIDRVMADAADLVTIRHTLHQLVNVKGN
jgi:tRNA-splicing ligase RtcB